MNRAERRRQARDAAKGRVIIAGDNIVATPLQGHEFAVDDAAGRMPDKQPGVHRWIVSASYAISLDQATEVYSPEAHHLMDHENLLYVGIGCWDCEQPLGPDVDVRSTCPAGDEWTRS